MMNQVAIRNRKGKVRISIQETFGGEVAFQRTGDGFVEEAAAGAQQANDRVAHPVSQA